MLSRVAEIAELMGQWRFAQSSQVPMLRRENRIRTIQVLLAIEPPESGTDDCSDWRQGGYLARSRKCAMPLLPMKLCRTGLNKAYVRPDRVLLISK